ncbi:MAG: 1-acyl-sn-glycerol-3-phosphate acyltransferase [Sphingomonas sp.]|nr:1-acyl-sn-glycerol-3-phosphate acyltransferase [Sphingomonas sp.]
MRIAWRTAGIAAGLLACVPAHYLARLATGGSGWPRRFLGHAGRRAGLRVRIEGRPLGSNVLFVANHESWLDILALGGATELSFVAMEELSRWPVVGWLAGLNRTIYVARAERGAVKGQADAVRAGLAEGLAVALFPEGTTEGGRGVLPFRPSLLASLYPPLPGVKVQPVAIDYHLHEAEIAWIGDEPAGANAKRMLSRKEPIPVTLRFLDPIDPAEAGDRKALAAQAHAAVVAALGASVAAPDPL